MLDLVNVIMNQFPDYQPHEDGIEKEISALQEGLLIKDSYIRIVPSKDLTIHSIRKEGADPFTEVFEQIRNEVIWFRGNFNEYYHSKVKAATAANHNESPTIKVVYRELFKRVIRARRLQCILSPYYTETKSYNSKSDKYYSNAKCYYVDQEGTSKRMVSKNIGTYGDEIETYAARLMKLNGYSIVAQPVGNMRLRPDFIMEKDASQYLVDVGLKSKDQFFRLLFTLELWSRYKEEYYRV